MFGRKKKSSDPLEDMLNQEFISWKTITDKNEPMTIRDAMNGIHAFGGSGAGKTSGTGDAVFDGAMETGCGAFFTCAKADEGERLKRKIIEAGRGDDLVYFAKDEGLYFNPLLYEMTREGKGAGDTFSLVNLIMNIYVMGKSYSGQSSGGGDAFWQEAMKRLLGITIDLLKLAGEDVTFLNIRKVIVSAFTEDQMINYKRLVKEFSHSDTTEEKIKEIEEELNEIADEKFCLQCLLKADEKTKDEEEEYTYGRVSSYFYQEFAFLSDKTRSSIEEHVYGLLEPFMSGILKKYFTSTISPELHPDLIYKERKLVICDFSVKEYGIAGVYGGCIMKYATQLCLERRDPKKDGYITPVLLYSDEAQYFINPLYDTAFQMTARASLVITCYLTQSLHNYVISFGGAHALSQTKSLLANFGNKVFHANTDFETNQMLSNIIGYKVGVMASMNDKVFAQSGSLSEQLMLQVQPNEVVTLKTGGPQNDYRVEAFVVKMGPWKHTQDNYIKVEFIQPRR